MTATKPDGSVLNDAQNKEQKKIEWPEKAKYVVAVSYGVAVLALFGVLKLDLLAALFSGLLVYALVHSCSAKLGTRISGHRGRLLSVAVIGAVVVLGLVLIIWGAVTFFQSDAGNMETLFQNMADIIDRSRDQIPLPLHAYLPASADALREMMSHWLREHASEAKTIGAEAGRTLAHILIGMIIGAMVTLHDVAKGEALRPLAAALTKRVSCLQQAFRKIVFAQVRISAINTAITAVFVLAVLPSLGVHLAFSKTLIAITFAAGLLPVVGNLISNSIMVVLGLAHSLYVALGCLAFLVVIHKLEYFLNARIIGSHIHASTWELLAVLLFMESWWGLTGVVAAPVFYAYLKRELMDAELV